MATKSVHPPRASFDCSVLSKRTSFEHLEKEDQASKKRCSLEVKSHQATPPSVTPGFSGFPPLGAAPWAPSFPGMSMGMPMGMPMGGMMPFCFPPPFIPPFMMPAAMAMWQQAVQQATATIPNPAVPPFPSCLMGPPPASMFAASPAPPAPSPPLPAPCDSPFSSNSPYPSSHFPFAHVPSTSMLEKSGSLDSKAPCCTTANSSSSVEFPNPGLDDNDFESFIDSFLAAPEGDLAHSLAQSFGCGLDLLADDCNVVITNAAGAGGSVSELSELTECCKPLDLKLNRDDSHLNLLDLDLSLAEELSH